MGLMGKEELMENRVDAFEAGILEIEAWRFITAQRSSCRVENPEVETQAMRQANDIH